MSIKISHPNIISPVYELVKVLEFDVDLGDDIFSLRLEVFRSLEDNCRFRAHLWTRRIFRIEFTNLQGDRPSYYPLEEEIIVNFSHYLTNNYDDFRADSLEAAIELIIDDLKRFLDKTNYGYNERQE